MATKVVIMSLLIDVVLVVIHFFFYVFGPVLRVASIAYDAEHNDGIEGDLDHKCALLACLYFLNFVHLI